MPDIKKLLSFAELINELRLVKRVVYVNGEDRMENDTEHSYSLAMLAWYIVSVNKLDLDIEKVMKYALAHDLVEAYAGDVHFYADTEKISKKKDNERAALEKIINKFPEFTDLHGLIHNYESREDEESKFVYALDKMQPALNIYLDGGRTWRADNVTLSMLHEYKDEKIALSPEVKKYWDQLIEILTCEEKKLFGDSGPQ